MPARDLQTSVTNNHQALAEYLAAARSVPAAGWSVPRAEGKWSPAQITEHLARVYELSVAMMKGEPIGIGGAPRVLQPLVAALVRMTILRTGRFPKGKAPVPFQPATTPALQDALCARLQHAGDALEQEVQRAAASGRTTFVHPFFGTFATADYVQLQAFHTAHHRRQFVAS